MTRENKLALIIGFALVLVVGILVSDHLSAAHRDEAADLAQNGQDAGQRFADADSLAPVGVDSDARRSNGLQLRPVNPAVNGTHAGPEAGNRDTADTERGPARIDGPVEIITPDLQDIQRNDREAEEARLGNGLGNGQGSPMVAIEWHTVRSGESLSRICGDLYGDPNLWPKLAEYNKDRVPDPNNVKEGTPLRIPPKHVLTGGQAPPTTASPRQQQPPPARERDEPPSQPATQSFTWYTVQSGDTLGDIARKELGTSRRYMDIYNINKDIMSSPDAVVEGTKIRIPKD